MGGTLAGLKEFFADAVAAFNTNQIGNLLRYLDPQIIVYSIDGHMRYRGNAAVAFLTQQFDDEPNFTYPPGAAFLPNAPDGEATQATISGTTIWKDEHGPEPLQFTFSCAFNGNKWLFTKLAAH